MNREATHYRKEVLLSELRSNRSIRVQGNHTKRKSKIPFFVTDLIVEWLFLQSTSMVSLEVYVVCIRAHMHTHAHWDGKQFIYDHTTEGTSKWTYL